jgi:predicted dehydrogenase
MQKDIIVVGAGECFTKLIHPGLIELQKEGLVERITTIDILDKRFDGVRNIVRTDKPISEIVDSLGYESPAVIFAHPNQFHTPEAVELIENSHSKPKLLLEKPYSISTSELRTFQELIRKNGGRIGLMEYYLNMKAGPLMIFAGLAKPESFYFTDEKLIKELEPNALLRYAGKLDEIIGNPLFVFSNLLEGQGLTGEIEHRTKSLVDTRIGGGMIQDLGHHAISSIIALEEYLGKLTTDSIRNVKTAKCKEYIKSSIERGIPLEYIGESYAEMSLVTSKGIPVDVALGKYVQNGTNERYLFIYGTKGNMEYDMTDCKLKFTPRGEASKQVLQANKNDTKYKAVVRSALECISGNNPFTFDPFDVALTAQAIALKALDMVPSQTAIYSNGAMNNTIFRG